MIALRSQRNQRQLQSQILELLQDRLTTTPDIEHLAYEISSLVIDSQTDTLKRVRILDQETSSVSMSEGASEPGQLPRSTRRSSASSTTMKGPGIAVSSDSPGYSQSLSAFSTPDVARVLTPHDSDWTGMASHLTWPQLDQPPLDLDMDHSSWSDWQPGHGPSIPPYSDLQVPYGAPIGAGALFEGEYFLPHSGHPTTLDIGISDDDDRMLFQGPYGNPNGSHDSSGIRGHMPSMG